jgi:hypothetical protein
VKVALKATCSTTHGISPVWMVSHVTDSAVVLAAYAKRKSHISRPKTVALRLEPGSLRKRKRRWRTSNRSPRAARAMSSAGTRGDDECR